MGSPTEPTFALIHGGQQGPWIFDRTIDALAQRGHRAVALEMPANNPEAGALEYARVIAEGLADTQGDVILVGHSMAGLTIPLVPFLRPIRQLVFLCGAYPEIGRSHFEVKQAEAGESVGDGPSAAWKTPGEFHMLEREVAREYFFHDSPPDLQEWALDRLRLQARKPMREVSPLVEWPNVPRSFIVATEDRCITLDSQLRTINRLFDEQPVQIPGGHCVQLSHPDAVAEVLISLCVPPTA